MIDKQLLQIGGASETAINNLTAAWDAWQKAMGQPVHQLPHIVCTGIYNAGKSTLLNALFNAEKFPTGNIPTTKKVSQAEFNGAVYVDTPGLNADEQDDRETDQAYESADLYLFVSNAENGGIGEQESRWLKALKGRYADENALKHRLVYVLSQGDRLEPETLQRVLEQSRTDLQKVLGFCPEGAFCVDSHTYSDGKEQNEPILVEDSGIPQLRTFLGKWTAEFAARLENLHQSEVTARRAEVVSLLTGIESDLQQIQQKKSAINDEKIQKLKQIWDDFESELKTSVSKSEKYIPFSVPYVSLGYRHDSDESKSFEKAWRGMKNMLSPYFNSMRSVTEEAVSPLISRISTQYLTAGMDSKYFQFCDEMNQVFESNTARFQDAGLANIRVKSIEAESELCEKHIAHIKYILGDLHEEIISRTVPDYYSLEDLVGGDDIYSYETEERGFFGYHDVTIWTYCCRNAVRKLEKRIAEKLEDRVQYVNGYFEKFWGEFCEKMQPQLDAQKTSLKNQIDEYCLSLKKGSCCASVDSALEHLLTLKKEVQT